MSKSELTPAERLAGLSAIRVLTRDDLIEEGFTSQKITAAVRTSRITRLRRGVYVSGDLPNEVAEALRVGGRISCLTLLRLIGVFVFERPGLHAHVPPHLSRSRHRRPGGITLHWGRCGGEGSAAIASLEDAVRQSVRCQPPRAVIATLDSVVHHRLLRFEQLEQVFRTLPQRFQTLLLLVDPSAESGPETFMRLLLRALGLPFETQVEVAGVGRVDFVVAGEPVA